MERNDFVFNGVNGSCSVLVAGRFSELAPFVREAIRGRKALILTDETVSGIILGSVTKAVSDPSAELFSFVIRSGEKSKSFEDLGSILTCMVERSFGRGDVIINLGGGMVGDIGGLAASVYMRGIDYINIPTTLLSMVDSSIGGKTGIDFAGIKNVIGTFRHPKLVADATEFLSSLSEHDIRSGFGEIVKYRLLTGMEIPERFESGSAEKLIANCAAAKWSFVIGDEFDNGKRKFLNLGHTFGHAFEAASSFRLSHGEAVALGIYSEALFAADAGLTDSSVPPLIKELLESKNLPTVFSDFREKAARFVFHDKKRSGESISMPFIKAFGEPFLADVPISKLTAFLESK